MFVDLMNNDEIKNCINRFGKFDIVTGDVGMPHGFKVLQEDSHYKLQRNQAAMAVNMCNDGGSIFLKMYTIITDECIKIVEELKSHFEELYIWKPFTSRITNNETYIVGLKKKKNIGGEIIIEKEKYYNFYYSLANVKNKYVQNPETFNVSNIGEKIIQKVMSKH